jgi:hypothetical protein
MVTMAPPQLMALQDIPLVVVPVVAPVPLLLPPLMPPPHADNSNTAHVHSPARAWRVDFDPSMV